MRLDGLERVLQRSMRRVRAQRALSAAAYTGVVAALGLLLAALAARFVRLPAGLGAPLVLLALLPLAAALLRALARVDRGTVARRLDRAHGLHDTVQAALEVSAQPAGQRSAFG